MKHTIEIVSDRPELWKEGDPVRPELGVSFKTYPGRQVYGLRDSGGNYVAFCCVARTWDIPQDIMSLSRLTSEDGSVYVPYTVWSLRRGAGKAIISELLRLVRENDLGIKRVVTLSPRTEMARNFHLRNGAKEVSSNIMTINFEYPINAEVASESR
jgi:hypothetical protein